MDTGLPGGVLIGNSPIRGCLMFAGARSNDNKIGVLFAPVEIVYRGALGTTVYADDGCIDFQRAADIRGGVSITRRVLKVDGVGSRRFNRCYGLLTGVGIASRSMVRFVKRGLLADSRVRHLGSANRAVGSVTCHDNLTLASDGVDDEGVGIVSSACDCCFSNPNRESVLNAT